MHEHRRPCAWRWCTSTSIVLVNSCTERYLYLSTSLGSLLPAFAGNWLGPAQGLAADLSQPRARVCTEYTRCKYVPYVRERQHSQ